MLDLRDSLTLSLGVTTLSRSRSFTLPKFKLGLLSLLLTGTFEPEPFISLLSRNSSILWSKLLVLSIDMFLMCETSFFAKLLLANDFVLNLPTLPLGVDTDEILLRLPMLVLILLLFVSRMFSLLSLFLLTLGLTPLTRLNSRLDVDLVPSLPFRSYLFDLGLYLNFILESLKRLAELSSNLP